MKKNIVILATYLGEINRGAETFVIELSKKLVKEFNLEIYSLGQVPGLENNIYTIDCKKNIFEKIHEKIFYKNKIYKKICVKIKLTPENFFQKKFNKIVYKKYLKNRSDIDLIFPNNGVYGAKISRKLREKFNIPYAYTGHGGVGSDELKILKEKPNLYIALSEYQKEWALKYINEVVKISNGIDISVFNNKTIKKRNSNTQKIIVCVGAFIPEKRQKLLIDAVSLLDNIKLILVGNGELKEKLTKYGKLKLSERFEILNLPYAEMKKAYQNVDLFSLPSEAEPFGIVYLEAMAYNIPIVASFDSIRQEIIGNAGILCNVKNAEEYANKIMEALSKDWKNIPRDRAAKYFNWDDISKIYIDHFKKLMS